MYFCDPIHFVSIVPLLDPLRKLCHPKLVPIMHVATLDKYILVKQPKLGVSLREVHSQERISLNHLRSLFQQIAAGLRFLHANGREHGDLKPENVLVQSNRKVKLLNFGKISSIMRYFNRAIEQPSKKSLGKSLAELFFEPFRL